MALLHKARLLLLNLVLFTGMSLLVYALVEWAFPRVFSRLFPLELVSKFDEPDGIWPLLQSSKSGFLPQQYIALAGDSYAMGMGDAMTAAGRQYRPRFHSAHTIQDLTGRDVVSFGSPGSGSIRSAISNPVAGLHYLHRLLAGDFPAPDWIVLYFYEGNDLTENWMYYEKTFLTDYPAEAYENPAIFDDYIRKVALGRQHLYLAAEAVNWKSRLLFYRYSYRIFSEAVLGKKFYRKKYPGEFGLVYIPENRWQPRKSERSVNQALVAGQVVPLPDNLQGPAMDLTPAQLQHAVGTFSKALAWSRQQFPATRFAVVYIPSVLASYQLAGEAVEAQNYFSDTDTRFAPEAVRQRHHWLRAEIARICAGQGVPLADTTADLQAAASLQLLHGPQDWNHLNGDGYRVLGESVVRQLPQLVKPAAATLP